MDHEAHVGFVHPHAEGDGRHHHRLVRAQELVEAGVAHLFVEARVVGQGRGSSRRQLLGQGIRPVSRSCIDHPGPPRPRGDQFQHAGAAPADLPLPGQDQLGAGKAVDEFPGVGQVQFIADVFPGAGVRRGGHRQAGGAGEDLRQLAQHPVFGAEVVAPLADAVGLVDGHQGDGQLAQAVDHRRLHQSLGGHVEQVQGSGLDLLPGLPPLVGAGGGVQARGGHTLLLQGRNLVDHQGDQRRDHHPDPRAHQAGNLVAQALAAAGGQDGHGAAAGQGLADDIGLQAAELRMPEGAAQQGARLVDR